MRLPKGSLWFVLIVFMLLTVSSCKPAAQTAAPVAKPSRWVEQWRSPSAQGMDNTPLGRFAYTCLSVVSANDVFVGGDIPDPKGSDVRTGIFVKTSDGGKNWTEMILSPPNMQVTTINAIHFLNPSTGWLAGLTVKQESVVLRTTDGGDTWEANLVGDKQVPTTIFFVDENHGWMGGTVPLDEDEFLTTAPTTVQDKPGPKKLAAAKSPKPAKPPKPTTADGGNQQLATDEKDIEEDGETNPSDLLVTSDGGKTWTSQRRLPVTLLDVTFFNKDLGWATGYRGAIYRTTDGGLSWNQQRSELETGEGSSLAIVGENSKKFKIYGAHFSDPQNGFAVATSGDGKEGRVLGTTTGGDSWAKKLIGADEGFRDVFFLSPNEGWVITTFGNAIYYTVDGGRYWNTEPVTFSQDVSFFDIQGTDPAHMWATAGGAIFVRLAQ